MKCSIQGCPGQYEPKLIVHTLQLLAPFDNQARVGRNRPPSRIWPKGFGSPASCGALRYANAPYVSCIVVGWVEQSVAPRNPLVFA